MNIYMYLVVIMAILLVFCLTLLLALWNRKEHYKAESDMFSRTAHNYYETIQKNAHRITQLKEIRDRFKAARAKAMREAYESNKANVKLRLELESCQETIKDYETIITLKDEELNEYDRAHPDAIIIETTKLIDRLRSVLIAKAGELRALKGFLARHGIDAAAALAEEPEMAVPGAPYFSQIAEPDPDNNRPEIEGCEVCDQQLSTPALESDPQQVFACF